MTQVTFAGINLFCSSMTRALLLSTYVKFVNLFPEIKHNVEEIFLADSNLRSADAELQQRASEYLALAKITSLDVLATVLEEMPPFPEKVSCLQTNISDHLHDAFLSGE